MTKYTKQAILGMFETMLREMYFDKITVSALVKRCEISPNTFYYHYHDIYDLLNAWMAEKKEKYLEPESSNEAAKENLKVIFHRAKEEAGLVEHLFYSSSGEQVQRYIVDSFEHMIDAILQQELQNDPAYRQISKQTREMVVNVCCYSLVGLLIKWLWGKTEGDIDEVLDRLFIFLDESVRRYIEENEHEPRF